MTVLSILALVLGLLLNKGDVEATTSEAVQSVTEAGVPVPYQILQRQQALMERRHICDTDTAMCGALWGAGEGYQG